MCGRCKQLHSQQLFCVCGGGYTSSQLQKKYKVQGPCGEDLLTGQFMAEGRIARDQANSCKPIYNWREPIREGRAC